MLLAPPEVPHDFAYVAVIARAAIALLDSPNDAFGQVWNMPCAPTRTSRETLKLGADAIGVKLKVIAVPLRLLNPLGIVSRLMREVADVGFTWDRPYVVDAGKFTRRFWADVTPFEVVRRRRPDRCRSAGGATRQHDQRLTSKNARATNALP